MMRRRWWRRKEEGERHQKRKREPVEQEGRVRSRLVSPPELLQL